MAAGSGNASQLTFGSGKNMADSSVDCASRAAAAALGATAEEWNLWTCDLTGLGLLSDIVPIVCDPNAEWSEKSTCRTVGKLPSEFNSHGKARGLTGWPDRITGQSEVQAWRKDPRLGFGVIAREARFIDIDVEDPEIANRIADSVDGYLAPLKLPRRSRANSGRLMLLLFVDRAESISKVAFPVEGGMIELLGNRQQAVVAGTHPSGARYEWGPGTPGRPEIAREKYDGLVAMLEAGFGIGGALSSDTRQRGEDFDAEDPVAAYLLAHGLSKGESTDGKKIYVNCPKQHLHSRVGDPTETVWQVAGSGGFALGHFDCKHTAHGRIGDREFLESVGYEEYERQAVADSFDVVTLAGTAVAATPYQWRDPCELPPRPWIYGRQLLRGSLSVLVAPGATGKTALLAGTSLALATGRPILGKPVHDGPKRVWLWNLEDSADELARLIQAACIKWGIEAANLNGRLFVDSALDGAELCTAVPDRNGVTIHKPVIAALVAELKSKRIDVMIVDPFVSSHRVPENDNGAIDAVAKQWARVAVEANCAILLAHHTSKTAGLEVTAEKARGAVALINAARSVIALNRMTSEEAGRLGIREENRRRYFRAYDDKNNRAPPAEASDWFNLESVGLGNGREPLDLGDEIQVVVPWTPPVATDGIGENELQRVIKAISAGEWRKAEQSPSWVGHAIADALSVDLDAPGGRQRVRSLLKTWIADEVLREESRPDANRVVRAWIVPGKTVCISPASVMQTTDATDAKSCIASPTPL